MKVNKHTQKNIEIICDNSERDIHYQISKQCAQICIYTLENVCQHLCAVKCNYFRVKLH